MHFARVRPSPDLALFVEWFWTTESHDREPHQTKIVPDGHPELIFHYGDPYRIRLKSNWQQQDRALLAGQLRHYCLLENTGRSGIFGITLTPTGLTHLFQLPMKEYIDQVVSLNRVPGPWAKLINALIRCQTPKNRIHAAESFFRKFSNGGMENHPIENCIRIMRREHGSLSVGLVAEEASVTERQMQRLFSQFVGLPPKYYARILRFSYIFNLIREGRISWADVVHLSGYYDQSHFIRDFKKFTGEDPTSFSFRDKSLTNFFTRKSDQRHDVGFVQSRSPGGR